MHDYIEIVQLLGFCCCCFDRKDSLHFFHSFNLVFTSICIELVATAPNNFKARKMPCSMCSI